MIELGILGLMVTLFVLSLYLLRRADYRKNLAVDSHQEMYRTPGYRAGNLPVSR
jgi:hypothetical protein